jgi:hypothetical protein
MSKEINVYWAPHVTWQNPLLGEWNMLYPEPTNLFSDLNKLRTKNAGTKSFLTCPAAKNKMKNSYVFKNTMNAHYEFDFTEENQTITPISDNYLNWEIARPPTINVGPTINFFMNWVFFSDQPLEMLITPPMLHRPNYTQYGTVIPGEFNIGKWFRPFALEVQMWDNKGKFITKEDEPFFYSEFKTDQKVNLQRFKMNGTLDSYIQHCSKSTNLWGMGLPLEKRYKKFEQSKMKDLILAEILQNLV